MTRQDANYLEEFEVPSVEFDFPSDPLCDLVRDYFIRRYKGEISGSDAAWLAGLIADFLSNEINLVKRSRLHAEYQILARRMIEILVAIDEAIERSKDPGRKWKEVSLALGLPSACLSGLSQAEVGRRHGLTKMGVSKAVNRLAAACGLEPAFGLQNGYKSFRNL